MPHPDPDQLALAALEENVDDDTARHLQTCPECRAELAGLQRVVHATRQKNSPASLSPPPAHVWDRIAHDVGLADPTPRQEKSGLQRRSRLLAAAAGFVLGVVGTGAAAYLLTDENPRPPRAVTVATADLQALTGRSDGRAMVVERDGERSLKLTIRQEAEPGADFRQVWLLDAERGRLVSLGVLAGSHASFALPSDLDLRDYPTVDVSAEPYDGDPGHSGDSVARGDLVF